MWRCQRTIRRWARVLVNRVRLERTRQFGACYLGLELWRRLELDRFFEQAVGRRTSRCVLVACGRAVGHQPVVRAGQRTGH